MATQQQLNSKTTFDAAGEACVFGNHIGYALAAYLKHVIQTRTNGMQWGNNPVAKYAEWQDLVAGKTGGSLCFNQSGKANIAFLEMVAINAIHQKIARRGELMELFESIVDANFIFDDAVKANINEKGSVAKIASLHPSLSGVTADDILWAIKALMIMIGRIYIVKATTKLTIYECVQMLLQIKVTVIPILNDIITSGGAVKKAKTAGEKEKSATKKSSTPAPAPPAANDQEDDF